MEENKKMIFLDGSSEEQNKAVKEFLSSMTSAEHEIAMSDEFDYLDED